MKHSNTSSIQKSLLLGMLVVTLLAASNSIVRAVDCPPGATVWTDGVGDWFAPANWDNGVPNIKCAFIDNDGVATIGSGHGTAFAHALYLGHSKGDSGSVVVDGADLEIQPYFPFPDCPGIVYVGKKGVGNLTIQNGKTVTCRNLFIGAETNPTRPNSDGTVTVENGASLLVKSGEDCELATGGAGICVGCDADGAGGGTAILNVKDATVLIDNVGAGALPPGVKVGPSGTLKANSVFTMTGSTSLSQTVSVSGTLAPSGTMTVQGYLDLNPSSSNTSNTIFHVTPTFNDSVEVSDATGAGQVTLGGRITVLMSGSFAQGSRFTLVHSAGGRLFNSTFAFTSIIDNGTGCYTATIEYDDNHNNVNLYLAPRNRCNN